MQRSGHVMVIVRPATEALRSITAHTTDVLEHPAVVRRSLSQTQLSSDLELSTDLGPVNAGTQKIDVELELLSGTTVWVSKTLHVQQGASGVSSTVGNGEVLDMSQPANNAQSQAEVVQQSEASPSKFRPQSLVFLIICPLMVMPAVAGVLLLVARRRQRLLDAQKQQEQEQVDGVDNAADPSMNKEVESEAPVCKSGVCCLWSNVRNKSNIRLNTHVIWQPLK